MENIYYFLLNNIIISLGFISTIIILIIFESIEYTHSINSINPNTAINLINHKNAILLDFRDKKDYKKIHIINSINIEIKEKKDYKKIIEKYRKKNIIIIHKNNYNAYKYTKIFKSIRENNIKYIYDGINAWIKSELPIIRADIK